MHAQPKHRGKQRAHTGGQAFKRHTTVPIRSVTTVVPHKVSVMLIELNHFSVRLAMKLSMHAKGNVPGKESEFLLL